MKTLIPKPLLSLYHLCLAYFSAYLYRYPSRAITIIGVTGTKGKSSTTEMINSILEAAGHKTALLNSIRIKIAATSQPNVMRMSMPGRFFIQRFLDDAVKAGCTHAILEMTSEGATQYRHRAIELDALVFLNLAPEHIESHGSYQAYADAKFELGKQLVRSIKRPRIVVANAEDAQASRYLQLPIEQPLPFSLSGNQPVEATDRGGYFTLSGFKVSVHLPGEFSLKNAIAAATVCRALGVNVESITRGLDSLRVIPGRAERVEAGQDFTVIVDYAHTPDSLEALYRAFSARKICVMGATGGGRDKWKRPVMGGLAEKYCDVVILTDEDPYDEEPRSIVEEVRSGMKKEPEVIMDRRRAIARAFSLAHSSDVVLITGKGTDPSMCVAHGKKIPWSDAGIAREELEKRARL